MKTAPIYAPEFELSPDQVGELNGLATRPMIFKIARLMAERGLRVTQTEVGRLIHRHTGQTPSKTTLKDAVDAFYAQALQTAMTRQALGQIPAQVMDALESIYLQIRQAAQSEFQSERESFNQTVDLLKQRVEEVETSRTTALAQVAEKDNKIESLESELGKLKAQVSQLQEKATSLQESASGFWNELLNERNAHQSSKIAHAVEIKQLTAAHQDALDSMRTEHQLEIKAINQESTAEIKRIGLANHEHTTKLLLQIDEIRAEAAAQSAKKDRIIESTAKETQKLRDDLSNMQAQLADTKSELTRVQAKQSELEKAAFRADDLDKHLANANKTIAELSASLTIAQKGRAATATRKTPAGQVKQSGK